MVCYDQPPAAVRGGRPCAPSSGAHPVHPRGRVSPPSGEVFPEPLAGPTAPNLPGQGQEGSCVRVLSLLQEGPEV